MEKVNAVTVGEFENELWEKWYRQNDEDCIFSDLTGLYVDIIFIISKTDRANVGIIYDYAKLLEQEIQLYTGESAYIAGQKMKDKSIEEVINSYILSVSDAKEKHRLDNRIQECFDKISTLLGDKNGLITEFTESYQRVHGMVKNNLNEFILLGQVAVA